MSYQSASSSEFLTVADSWIRSQREVLAMIRFSHAGGNRSYEFFDKFGAFEKRLEELPAKTCVIVFRKQQLPLRGVVDTAFIQEAKQLVQDGEEYLFTELNQTIEGKHSWFRNDSDDSHIQMADDLHESLGARVAFGPFPPWIEDSDTVISAVVPQTNGDVICGVY